ncbi:MAG: ABC transporter permease subunit [Hyphomicrobium sp.]
MQAAGKAPPIGRPANPIYLPAPHEVLQALWRAVVPSGADGKSLLVAFGHSVQIIFWAFLISSLIGVPVGILCGAIPSIGRLTEPFIEFFRYLPAPAFGALAVAVLGIYDGPKIAVVVIGTLFQQVLIIAATTRRIDYNLLEAAQTLGAKGFRLIYSVIIPSKLPDLYRDQRILLGWAWTYLIVAELVGTSSGITFFITQQAATSISTTSMRPFSCSGSSVSAATCSSRVSGAGCSHGKARWRDGGGIWAGASGRRSARPASRHAPPCSRSSTWSRPSRPLPPASERSWTA